MSIDVHKLIEATLALPKTHAVETYYADGRIKRFETHSAKSAETYAIGQRHKIGRRLIDRETGKEVFVTFVDVVEL